MKKIYKISLVLLILLSIIFGYIQFKFNSTNKAVMDYLIDSEGLSKDSLITEPFMANLSGSKNWMVSVKIEGDSKTYYYYLNRENKVVLESYVENGVEKVMD
ncbi:hypothetical protein [Lysinibacillus xylanilyticus]|uniref:DUF3139 domain-containing protein n=1 Tax=Lysinibacillus xylanilyticus TaxID=582475 RepID=A0ABV3VV72_9BACI